MQHTEIFQHVPITVAFGYNLEGSFQRQNTSWTCNFFLEVSIDLWLYKLQLIIQTKMDNFVNNNFDNND